MSQPVSGLPCLSVQAFHELYIGSLQPIDRYQRGVNDLLPTQHDIDDVPSIEDITLVVHPRAIIVPEDTLSKDDYNSLRRRTTVAKLASMFAEALADIETDDQFDVQCTAFWWRPGGEQAEFGTEIRHPRLDDEQQRIMQVLTDLIGIDPVVAGPYVKLGTAPNTANAHTMLQRIHGWRLSECLRVDMLDVAIVANARRRTHFGANGDAALRLVSP